MQKFCAPLSVRKQPDIFCFTLGIRMARSPRLLVNGTRRLVMKRSTAAACSRMRRSKLNTSVCLTRPRRLFCRTERGPILWTGKLMLIYQLVRRIHETHTAHTAVAANDNSNFLLSHRAIISARILRSRTIPCSRRRSRSRVARSDGIRISSTPGRRFVDLIFETNSDTN